MSFAETSLSVSLYSSNVVVENVGDFNGDGYADFVVGAPDDAADRGRAFVVYGDSDGLPLDVDLATLAPSEGFEINGADPGDLLGDSVHAAGDINGDGFADVIVGAPGRDVSYSYTSTYQSFFSTYIPDTYTVQIPSYGYFTYTVFCPSYSTYFYTNTYTISPGYSTYISTYSGGYSTYIAPVFGYSTYSNVVQIGTYSKFYYSTYIIGYSTYTVFSGYTNFYTTTYTNTYTGLRTDAGAGYVIFGTAAQPASVDINALGSAGIEIIGASSFERLGDAVAEVDDFNGDGIDDVALSSGRSYSSNVWIVFGSDTYLPDQIDLNAYHNNYPDHYRLFDNSGLLSDFGDEIDGGGDINGDGFGDVIVGAERAYGPGYSYTYTTQFFGTYTSFYTTYVSTYTNTVTYTNLISGGYTTYISTYSGGYSTYILPVYSTYTATNYYGPYTNVFTYFTPYTNTYTYTAYRSYAPDTGAAYIFFGENAPPSGNTASSALYGTNGFVFQGTNAYDRVGSDVAIIGDVNGDGYDDALIGARGVDGGSGAAYVVFGDNSPFPVVMTEADLTPGVGFTVGADADSNQLGRTVAGVGDFNGDGIDDFVVVDGIYGPQAGRLHLIFGAAGVSLGDMTVDMIDGTNGFTFNSIGGGRAASFGVSVAGSNTNGDQYSDILIGNANATGHVILGDDNIMEFIDGLDGTEDGQINMIYFEDPYAIGSDRADALAGFAGTNSFIFGLRGNDTLLGDSGADSILGGLGFDSINGGSGADTVFGGAAADLIQGGSGSDFLRGGRGNDIIEGGIGNDFANGDLANDSIFGNAGADTLLGAGGDDSIQGGDGDDDVRGGNGFDTVLGGTGDDRVFGDASADLLAGGGGNDTIKGGSGADTINGGLDDDLLQGEGSADTFVFSGDFGNDRITDFDEFSNAEKISLAGVASIVDYADLVANHMTQVGGNVIIDDGLGNTIRVDNALIADMNANDFLF